MKNRFSKIYLKFKQFLKKIFCFVMQKILSQIIEVLVTLTTYNRYNEIIKDCTVILLI